MELDLWTELQQKSAQLNTAVKTLRNSGSEYAAAERDYKVLLRTECLKLKDEGVAIGLIDKTCYGIPSVAEARFKRDVSEAVYKANRKRSRKPHRICHCTRFIRWIMEQVKEHKWSLDCSRPGPG